VPGQQPETLGLLWNGVDTLVIAGPSSTHLGGHAERSLAYRDAKLDWVRSLGYIFVAKAKHQGVLSASWAAPKLSRRDRRLVERLRASS
jgi:hypothetical protein